MSVVLIGENRTCILGDGRLILYTAQPRDVHEIWPYISRDQVDALCKDTAEQQYVLFELSASLRRDLVG